MTQYEIRWADLPAPAGRRPVLLLSRPGAYRYLNKIIVAEVTSVVRSIPQEVSLGADEGLTDSSVANLDNVRVVAKACLDGLIGVLRPACIREVKRALGYALDWPELKVL